MKQKPALSLQEKQKCLKWFFKVILLLNVKISPIYCIKVNGFAKHLYINKTKAVYYVKAAIDQNLKNIQIT